jgi:hypothetical protein
MVKEVAVTSRPVQSDPLVGRLEDITRKIRAHRVAMEAQRNSGAPFAFIYERITQAIAESLANAEYADANWVVTLAEEFAGRYLAAIGAPGDATAWSEVFRTLDSKRTSLLEELALPLFAHIVADLPPALVAVGMRDEDGRSRVADFHRVNNTMSAAVSVFQDEVAIRYGSYLQWLDRLGRQYDEILTRYGILLSRGVAWYNAERLSDPASAIEASEAIQRSPAIFVHAVMNPPIRSLELLLRAMRWVAGLLRRWPPVDPLTVDPLAVPRLAT